MMHIGFTGTSRLHLVSEERQNLFRQMLSRYQVMGDFPSNYFHHGDCIGADAFAHKVALDLHMDIVVHPPINPKARAFCKGYYLCKQPKEYLKRNRDIVDACSLIFAMPIHPDRHEVRTGEWATIRYARKKGVRVVLC